MFEFRRPERRREDFNSKSFINWLLLRLSHYILIEESSLFPLSCVMTLKDILLHLNGKGVQAKAYADKRRLLISGQFPSTISEIKERPI